MSNTVEFTINARDQASRAVEAVQNKIKNFGADLAKGVLAFAGPMALVTGAIGMISSAIEEYKTKVKEAVDGASKLKESASDLGMSVKEYQDLSSAADNAGISLNKVVKAYQEINGVLEKAKTNAGSQAMLEALGFETKDIVDGNVKAIQVIEKLGAAMLGASNDTDAFKVATAVLGETLAKDLLPVLQQAGKLASGFVEDSGLTEEEAQILKDKATRDKKAKNQEALVIARREAVNEFLRTDKDAGKVIAQMGLVKGDGTDAYAKERAANLADTFTSESADFEKAVLDFIKQRAEAEKKRAQEANKAAADAVLAREEQVKAEQEAQDFADKAVADAIAGQDKVEADAKKDADKKKEAEKKKQDADRDALGKALDEQAKLEQQSGSKMTLSSLREIGGGLAGEAMVNDIDLQRQTLDIQQKILIELQKLNIKTLPEAPGSIDFTKTQNIA